MTISVLISTFNERIKNVRNVLLPPRSDVEYIVSHQYTNDSFRDIPEELVRSDVKVSQIEGKGVTKSRNNAMRQATGDIAILADDDITYRPEYIDTVKQAFRNYSDFDIILFKIKTLPGEPEYKNYRSHEIELKKITHAVSTIEIAFKIDRIKKLGVFFDERFGVGHELLINTDETIFLEDCFSKGAKVMYVPEYIVEHPYESTIKSIPKYDKRRNWVVGAYDCRKNGKIAIIKAFLGTIKILPDLLRHKKNPITYCYHRLSAAIFILRTNNNKNPSLY